VVSFDGGCLRDASRVAANVSGGCVSVSSVAHGVGRSGSDVCVCGGGVSDVESFVAVAFVGGVASLCGFCAPRLAAVGPGGGARVCILLCAFAGASRRSLDGDGATSLYVGAGECVVVHWIRVVVWVSGVVWFVKRSLVDVAQRHTSLWSSSERRDFHDVLRTDMRSLDERSELL